MTTLAVLVAIASASGCVGTIEGDGSAIPGPVRDAALVPVASLALEGGTKLEFFDLGRRAMVMESGAGASVPVFDRKGSSRADRMSSTWRKFAPNVAIPPALTALEDRLMAQTQAPRGGQPNTPIQGEQGGMSLEDVPVDPSGETLAAPDGCNNICCDREWLIRSLACGGQSDYNFFITNWGWSWVKGSDIFYYDGLVCAAQGTTTWRVSIEGGGGGQWTVPEGSWRTYWSSGGIFDDPDIYAQANSATDMHRHAHCATFTN